MGESICHDILGAREVNEVTGKLQEEVQLPLLPGQPGRRNSEQRVCERFVVIEQCKIPTFQEETEVSHGGVSIQELMVEGRVMGLLGEENQRRPGSMNQLL